MKRTLVPIYLYICALSILSQSPSCLAQTTNSAARHVDLPLISSCSDGQICDNEELAVDRRQNEARTSDETNQRIQRDQLIDKQTRDSTRHIRRKRGLRDAVNTVRLQGSSNPAIRTGLASSEQRFKKSDHRSDQSSNKLVNAKNNAKISFAGEVSDPEDQANQDKRELHKQQVARISSSSKEETEAKSGQKEAKKRSPVSSEAARVIKPKSRAIKESELAARGSVAKDKRKVRDNGGHTALGEDPEVQKPESRNEQLGDEVDFGEKSAEYEVTGDDDDDLETPARIAGYKKNNQEVSQTGEGSEKFDLAQGSVEDDDFERQEMAKRETGIAGEEYEDIEDQDDTCEDVNLVDESNSQQAKIQSEAGLIEKREKSDSRVKRHNIGAAENDLEKNQASNPNGAAKHQMEAFRHLEDVKEDPDDNSKREISQTAIAGFSKSSLRPQEESLEAEVVSGNVAKYGQAEPVVENGNEETNEGSKREARSQQEVQIHRKDTSTAGEQSDVRLDGENNGGGEPIGKYIKKEAVETKPSIDDDSDSSKQESNLEMTKAKDNELDSDYEKKVEEQIQQRIELIKEQVKREVEEKQRIREIEANNAKYDEIQSEIEEDEDEDNQSLDIPNERESAWKRSIVDKIRSPPFKNKRHVIDVQQLRAIEGVEKLDPDVWTKAQLRHETIHKRSAPIYGAADQDALDTSKPLTKRSANPRRVHLVNNEPSKSPIPKGREVGNPIIIPEQAHVNIEDELPPGLSLDPNLLEEPSSPVKFRFKRSPNHFARRRRASAIIPEGRVAFLGYRPQDDDENDEGSEFDDDGFEDRTSNLHQDNSQSYIAAHVPTRDQYHGDEPRDENHANFLFAGVDRSREDFAVRRKRAEIRDDEEPACLRGGGALARRQTRARAKQMQAAKISSRKNVMDRDKRQVGNRFDDTKFDSLASLVGSSQELSPRLATEYKEAFGGLQSDPSGSLARFKRVKRDALSIVP